MRAKLRCFFPGGEHYTGIFQTHQRVIGKRLTLLIDRRECSAFDFDEAVLLKYGRKSGNPTVFGRALSANV